MKPKKTGEEAYDLGWRHGYADYPPDCPYLEGTEEYKKYFEGYEQGGKDC